MIFKFPERMDAFLPEGEMTETESLIRSLVEEITIRPGAQ